MDEISYEAPPAPPLSQLDDIPPEMFCNGDNRPAGCGTNCECTHTVDIPLNAIVEVVLVDEGKIITYAKFKFCVYNNVFISTISKSEPSVPSSRL